MSKPATKCPNSAAHETDAPDGYLAWHAWAERMSKTHRQVRCPGCHLYVIWVRRSHQTQMRQEALDAQYAARYRGPVPS